MNPFIERLKCTGLYSRFKNSSVQDIYWNATDKRKIEARNQQVKFYRDLLEGFRPGDLIFDIGANVGQKTDCFLRLGARVVAVDPDEHNQRVLRGKFIEYRLSPKAVSIVAKAVSDEVAVKTIWIDGPGSALNTLSKKWVDTLRGNRERFDHTVDPLEFRENKKIETTTLEQLIANHGAPFFIKIDVEGHELSVLRGLRSAVPYVSFEVNLPEFREEGLQCLKVLQHLSPAGLSNFVAEFERGLVLERWAKADQVEQALNRCDEGCIEVFWRQSPARGW